MATPYPFLEGLFAIPELQPILQYFFKDQTLTCTNYMTSLDFRNFLTNAGSSCFNTLVAKLIGLAIILMSCIIKLPTFRNILKNKSAEGFAFLALYGEVLMFTNAASYGLLMGYPFAVFGETLTQLLQSCFMVVLIWNYSRTVHVSSKVFAIACYFVYLASIYLLLPDTYYWILPRLNWPMVILTRGAQISENFKVGHTGSQSLFTIFMQMFGSAIRIFTTLKLVGLDFSLLCGFMLGTILNGILFIQYLLFIDNTRKFTETLKSKKDDGDSNTTKSEKTFNSDKKKWEAVIVQPLKSPGTPRRKSSKTVVERPTYPLRRTRSSSSSKKD